jgi:tricorn protease
MADLFRIPVAGRTALPVTSEPYLNEFFGSVAPDGQRVAFSARGIASNQWWRHGHSHIDESELWIASLGADAGTEQITPRGAKALWPMWAPDGPTLFFVSDRSGHENVYRLSVPAKATAESRRGSPHPTTLPGRGGTRDVP